VNCRDPGALATAQANLKDEQTKTQALSRERDAALQAARGGSVLRRVVRAAKWFVIGAAAGAVAARLRDRAIVAGGEWSSARKGGAMIFDQDSAPPHARGRRRANPPTLVSATETPR